MFVSGWKWKTRKIMISSPVPRILRIVNVCQGNTDRKRKREDRMKKDTDRTQTKLNALYVRYNVKTLPQ